MSRCPLKEIEKICQNQRFKRVISKNEKGLPAVLERKNNGRFKKMISEKKIFLLVFAMAAMICEYCVFNQLWVAEKKGLLRKSRYCGHSLTI